MHTLYTGAIPKRTLHIYISWKRVGKEKICAFTFLNFVLTFFLRNIPKERSLLKSAYLSEGRFYVILILIQYHIQYYVITYVIWKLCINVLLRKFLNKNTSISLMAIDCKGDWMWLL